MSDPSFVDARARIEAKRELLISASAQRTDKTTDAATAGRVIRDGDHVAIGGCLFSRTPMTMIREIVRQERHHLTLSRNLMGFEGELLMAAGSIDRIVTSWQGLGLPWGISKVLRHHVESGAIEYEEWSHLGLGLRYRAAAMGLPFLPTLTMLGSDLMDVTASKTITCPFTGATLNAVPALFPDVALLHVHRADRSGNCQIDGYSHMDADIALAATTVIVSAEEVVDDDQIRLSADRTTIPGMLVDAVVEAPLGAMPGECYGMYETDFSFFDRYVDRINAAGMSAVDEFLDTYVRQTTSPVSYADLFAADVVADRRRAARDLMGALP